jgi:integrase/recombinase XerD
VGGKTGPDSARIGASAPKLATWLDNHPQKNNPESPLWIVKATACSQLTYGALRSRLKKILDRAGLKKRVWPYLFRHSRIAPSIHRLTDEELDVVYGWKPGSQMKEVYIHLGDDDRDQAFLKMNGMQRVDSTH